MDERARRLGLNEAMFRNVNEEIEQLNRQLGGVGDRTMQVVCECGSADCMERLSISIDDYERVRADGALFLLIPGHEVPDVEVVVEQEPGWWVVRKKEPGPAAIAEETDPRS